jgi:hypothetical protein
VVASAAQSLCALSHARPPKRQVEFGGADWGKRFLLDEHDRLTELASMWSQ